jgi:hypothetical protein
MANRVHKLSAIKEETCRSQIILRQAQLTFQRDSHGQLGRADKFCQLTQCLIQCRQHQISRKSKCRGSKTLPVILEDAGFEDDFRIFTV